MIVIIELHLQVCVIYTSNLQRYCTRIRSFFNDIHGFDLPSMVVNRTSILFRRFAKGNVIIHHRLHFWRRMKLFLLIVLVPHPRLAFIILVFNRMVDEIVGLSFIVIVGLLEYTDDGIKIIRDISAILLGIVYHFLLH